MKRDRKKEGTIWRGVQWSREIKRFLGGLLLAGLVGIVLCNLLADAYRKRETEKFGLAVASMVGSVKAEYPSVSEEEVLQVLNDGSYVDSGRSILEKYGVFLEDGFLGWQKDMQRFQVELSLLLAGVLLVFAGAMIVYLRRRQQRINTFCGYINALSRGNDTLDIEDNWEDELSGLKNELYKLTVFFREQALCAEQNKKALSEAVADIAYQIKTPLTSVTVLVDNLLDHPDMDLETRHRFLRETGVQLAGVNWLVATLLKLSRLDAGVVEMEKKEVFLLPLAEEVAKKLELSAELREVELLVNLPVNLRIQGDFQWLSEALLNIVKNAVEHSHEGGRIRIDGEDNEVYTLVTVADNGEGISPEDQKHMFERFYRGKGSRADSVGIGLHLSKEIIERHDGYVTVESRSGGGTVFFLKFLKCH